MFRVTTQEESQRSLLQQQSVQTNGAFSVFSTQVQPLIEMVRSITYEYFQTDVPLLAKRVRDLCLDAFNMTFSFSIFRQVMTLIKKQTQLLAFHQNYILTMNIQLSSPQLRSPNSKSIAKDNHQNVEPGPISDHNYFTKNLVAYQSELPLQSKIQMKADSKTQKSMRSQIVEVNGSFVNSISKFSQFLKPSNLFTLKQGKEEIKNDSSIELEQFQKTGKDLMQSNIEALIRQQMFEDIKKDLKSVRKIVNNNRQLDQYRCNRQIKNCVMNSKLKLRKNK